jgi:hypothetical protein
MKIYTHIQKGEAHPVFCEDFLMVEHDLSERFLIASVMDGCSGGKETHFTSALIAKSFRSTLKALEMENWFESGSASSLTEILIHSLVKDFRNIREKLQLITEELVSTLILMIYDSKQEFAHIISVGDGTIVINNEIHRIEQQNMPDYLVYHLKEDFSSFYKKMNYFQIQSPTNLAISTDGVDSFFDRKLQACPKDVAKDILLNDLDDGKRAIDIKIQQLYEQHNQIAQDDLAIVRLVF